MATFYDLYIIGVQCLHFPLKLSPVLSGGSKWLKQWTWTDTQLHVQMVRLARLREDSSPATDQSLQTAQRPPDSYDV